MRDQRVYQIRQAILRSCKDCHPMPLTVEQLPEQPAMAFVPRVTRAELSAEWDGLAANGYLSVIPDSDGEYRVINAKGLNQINHEGGKDKFIFGAAGMVDKAFRV